MLIAIDGLRADRVGCYGHPRPTTPHLDALAGRGLRYADVVAPSTRRAASLEALLSGRHPGNAAPELLPPQATRLPERLAATGFQTCAVGGPTLAGLGARFQESLTAPGAGARVVTEAALEFLDRSGEQPFFLLVHYEDPLPPFEVEIGALEVPYGGPIRPGLSAEQLERLCPTLTREDRTHLGRLYDAQIAAVDRQLGRLVERLERDEQTLIAVVGTGGLELFERGGIGETRGLGQELLSVPWVLAGPRVGHATFRGGVSLVDVAPTLLVLVERSADGATDGTPVLPGLDPRPPARVVQGVGGLAVIGLPWKLVQDREGGTRALYDLLADPGESRDRSADSPEKLEELETALAAWEAQRKL